MTDFGERKVLSHVFPNVLWKIFGSIGQEILQMAGVQPTLIKVQQKFPYTNINTIEKFVKQTTLGKHGVDFRTAVTRREGSALEWTLTGTSASSGEAKVGVKYIFGRYICFLILQKSTNCVGRTHSCIDKRSNISLTKRTVSINNTMLD